MPFQCVFVCFCSLAFVKKCYVVFFIFCSLYAGTMWRHCQHVVVSA
jgi:uncharacterized membrane protein